MRNLHETILGNLRAGFEETMASGMPSYVVPLSTFPPELLDGFRTEYAERVPTKLDMGKSCIRFKNPKRIPFELLGALFAKMTPDAWVARYQAAR